MKKIFFVLLLFPIFLFSQNINYITPDNAEQGMSIPVVISTSNIQIQNLSTISSFRISQNGANLLNGTSNSVSGNNINGTLSIPPNQNTGFYDLEVLDMSSFNWIPLSNAFEVKITSPWNQMGSSNDGNIGTYSNSSKAGYSVAISNSGNIYAHGAPAASSSNIGYVSVYNYSGYSWSQIGNDISGVRVGDIFGHSISLSGDGNYIAIGAPNYDVTGSQVQGMVRVLENTAGTWTQVGSDIVGANVRDYSGQNVELNDAGNILAIVGCKGYAGGSLHGDCVKIYENMTGNSWTEVSTISLSNIESISFNSAGNILAIGCPNDDIVYVYENISGSWSQITSISGSSSDDFGQSVSLNENGDRLAIGIPKSDISGANAGATKLFENTSGTWTQMGTTILGEGASDQSGFSVSLDNEGNKVAIGEPLNDDGGTTYSNYPNAGQARVFRYYAGDWQTQVGVDLNGTINTISNGYSYGDDFGRSIALSGDGNAVVIGAPGFSNANYIDIGQSKAFYNCEDTSIVVSASACDTFSFNGNTLTSSGNFSWNYNNFFGCDSTIYLNLTIINSSTVIDTVETCDSYSWRGNTYTSSGTYNWTGTNYLGCDSIAILNLTINNSEFNTYNEYLCFGDSIIIGSNTYYFSNTNDTLNIVDTLLTEFGCDSIVDVSLYSGFSGCTDANAFNYDPLATCNDGSCCSSSLYESLIGAYIDGDDNNDELGYDVSFNSSGSRMAISAILDEPSGNSHLANNGSVSVLEFDGSSWVQLGQTLYGTNNDYKFGKSISLNGDGDVLAVGCPNSDNGGSEYGEVFIYSFNGSSWSQIGQFNGQNYLGQLGFSVSLNNSGNIVAFSSPFHDNSFGTNSGKVEVWEFSSGSWNAVGYPIYGADDGDRCGKSLDLSSDGTTLVIGSDEHDANGINESGQVRIFEWNGFNWLQKGQNIDGIGYGDHFGGSVSISGNGNTIAAGAIYTDINFASSGSIKLFEFDGNIWNQVGQQINGTSSDANFGIDLSLNSIGNRVAAGASEWSNSGYVSIYQRVNDNWIETSNISGLNNQQANFGNAVSLNDNGNKVVIGAPKFDGLGYNRGLVVAYSVSTPCSGCTDTTAFNYDPYALIDDSSCNLPIYGCTDSLAFNYDSLAHIDDGSCIPFYYGCIDSIALNYDSLANTDDGSCIYCVYGCMDSLACNYDALATCDDGSCLTIYGCTDPLVCNYDPLATCDDGSCITSPVYGCTDSLANNYNSLANCDDGSCCGGQSSTSLSFGSQIGQDILGEIAGDQSGMSISLSSDGNTLAIGSPLNDNNGWTDNGQVRVYENISGSWVQIGNDIDGLSGNDDFGGAVSLSANGNILAVGAKGSDLGGNDAGQVRVFENISGNWTEIGQAINGESANDMSGSSVTLNNSGSIVAIGSPFNYGNGGSGCGSVKIYEYNGSSWSLMAWLDGENIDDNSGKSISLSGDGFTLAIGATGSDDGGSNSGHVRIYQYHQPSNNWSTQLGQDIAGEFVDDESGYSVSLSNDGDIVAIGAPYNDDNGSNSGHVRVYSYNGSSWTQLGQDIDGEAAYMLSGFSISISDDGNYLAVAAPNNDIVDTDAGLVQVYEWNGTDWIQLGYNLLGESIYNYFGTSIAYCNNKLAISAPYNNNGGTDAGLVGVYSTGGVILGNSPCYGCTDSLAINFDSTAEVDDGSCCYFGCTDPNSSNFNPSACVDDSSCVPCIYGCMDSLACNYDSLVTCDDGSCYSIYGCMDSLAVNYDSTACFDDGSCLSCYAEINLQVDTCWGDSVIISTTELDNVNYSWYNSNASTISESFEFGLGDWINDPSNSLDWTINSGSTPSTNTGPSDAYDGNNYIYTETSGGGSNSDAYITSPILNFNHPITSNISFAYHLYGSSMGTLNFEISQDGGVSWLNIWSISGDQGDQWYVNTIDLSSYSSTTTGLFKVRFHAQTGNSYTSDMAIDNIVFTGINPVQSQSLSVGDYVESSVVFWVDPNIPQIGLGCYTSSITTAEWGCQTITSTSIGTGLQNTLDIVSNCGPLPNNTSQYNAAEHCHTYSSGNYSNWFLPSADELTEMWNNKDVINSVSLTEGGNSLGTLNHWSSSIFMNNLDFAYYVHFGGINSGTPQTDDRSSLNWVRPIRQINTSPPTSNNNSYTFNSTGWVYLTVTDSLGCSFTDSIYIAANCGLGCIDPLANNFNPLAFTDDSTCVYSLLNYGCTDSSAINYDLLANTDDGSCCYNSSIEFNLNSIIDGEFNEDYFGFSSKLNSSGDRIVVGAYGNDQTGSMSGKVQVYEKLDSIWIQIGQDLIGSVGEGLGKTVDINDNGNIIAVVNNNSNVTIYELISSIWTQIGNLYEGTNDAPIALDSSGTIIAIGTRGFNGSNGSASGKASVHKYDGITWNQIGQDLFGDNSPDVFGSSIAINNDGTIIAVGAPYSNAYAGSVRVFEYNSSNTTWYQIGTDIIGDCCFGWNISLGEKNTISLSNDGSIIACGSGAANDYEGGVKIYQNDGNDWQQKGQEIIGMDNGVPNNSTGLGSSVDLNGDGNFIAIGSYDFPSVYRYDNFMDLWERYDDPSASLGSARVVSISISDYANELAIGDEEYVFDPGPGTVSYGEGRVFIYDINHSCDELGCTDPLALNFDVFATIDNGNCIYCIYGCNDPLALNYDSLATCDDGSCISCNVVNNLILTSPTDSLTCNGIGITNSFSSFPIVSYSWEDYYGVVVSSFNFAFNLCEGVYFVTATDSIGCSKNDTIIFGTIYGCMDPLALNYNYFAVYDDGSCTYPIVYGCIDSLAYNYDSLANTDDGTCLYCDLTNSFFISQNTTGNCDGFILANSSSSNLPITYLWSNGNTLNNISGLCSGIYTITIADNVGCTIEDTIYMGITLGCTDPLALNFNPLANMDDGSCIYPIYGCTDSTALNYDSTATVDDGSCCYIAGCTDVYSCNYDSLACLDDSSCFGLIGCIDSLAYNYDSLATCDDGSCSYCDLTNSFIVSQNTTGNCDGFVLATSSSSNLPITYLWSNGSTLNNISGLCSGIYTITITDNVGCTIEDTIYLGIIYGCTDSTSSNYNPLANTDDGSCISCVYGCMDSLACNYDSLATCDDGSCLTVYGCTDSTSFNYDVLATCDDGSCLPFVYGCTDSTALNYDILANTDDGSCLYCVYGCTDSTSFNYDVLATCDDGSCLPYVYGCTDSTALNYDVLANTDDGSCLYCVYGCTDTTSFNYDVLATCDDGSCLPFVYGCTDSLALNYDVLANTDDGSCLYCVYGCTDSTSFNYDILATCDDGSCLPFVYGCTDSTAINYNSFANTDDGSCLYVGCTDSSFCNYNSQASFDDGSCFGYYGCTDSLFFNYDINAGCDDGSCLPFIYGCTDPLATNYDPLANTDNGSCNYMNCTSPKPDGLYSYDVIDTRAKIGWNNMNDSACMVLKYFVRYREVGTNSWNTKSAGVGNGLCIFGLNTVTKQLLNLSPSTLYEFKMKAFYCGGTSSNYSPAVQFTTSDVCPDMTNLSVQTFNNNTSKAKFTWDTTGVYTFARILLRVDTAGANWQTAGGFGVYYPTFFVNKFGLQSGESYRAQGRTFCDSNITAYRSPIWTAPVFWTQPGTIRLDAGSNIKNLDIYPNPSRDIFNISFNSETLQDLNIRIINTLGSEVYRENKQQFIGEYTKQISLVNYDKGIYFLEIETNDGVINKKLILQ